MNINNIGFVLILISAFFAYFKVAGWGWFLFVGVLFLL